MICMAFAKNLLLNLMSISRVVFLIVFLLVTTPIATLILWIQKFWIILTLFIIGFVIFQFVHDLCVQTVQLVDVVSRFISNHDFAVTLQV